MAKPHPRAELDQARLGRRRRRFGADTQLRRGHAHQRGIAERLGRRDKQQAPGLVGENFDSPAEILFDAVGYSRRGGQPKSARELLRSQSTRQLQQCKRVAPSLGKDLIADPCVQRRSQGGFEQRSRISVTQALHDEVRQSCDIAAGHPGRENQSHRFRTQAASNKAQDLRRGPVEPLLVIDH
ncbi:MAG: hypothetical protein WA752_14120, partial [Mycobacterium sp.]